MAALMRSLVLGCLAAITLAACYETPKPPCMFLCGEGGACPSGYVCVTEDNRCHRDDTGGPAECVDELPGEIDASTLDAAPIDAALIDAAPIDASIPDAAPPDAAAPDAAL